MSKTVRTTVKYSKPAKRGFLGLFKRGKKTVSKNIIKVKKPNKWTVVEGMKDEGQKLKAIKSIEGNQSLRLLGTETAQSVSTGIAGAAAGALSKVDASSVMNQNINGGAKDTSNHRDDDEDNPEVA